MRFGAEEDLRRCGEMRRRDDPFSTPGKIEISMPGERASDCVRGIYI
jgi:hypothetical protein